MRKPKYSRHYDELANHLVVPTLRWSQDLLEQALAQARAEQQPASTPEQIAKREEVYRSTEEYFREALSESSPLKEYKGYVWELSEAKGVLFDSVPKTMVRVWARAPFSAGAAVDAHLGTAFGHSLWNDEDKMMKR